MKRIERERTTLQTMFNLHCRKQHNPDHGLCFDCAALLAYARERLASCRYGNQKPTCAQCPAHCYKPQMREAIRKVMRFSGPRMPLYHPYLALAHLFHSLSSR